MDYKTYKPHPDLETIVKCYWTLEVPEQKDVQRQLILPDGCVDMCFSLGDDIKRYTSGEDFVIQPRQMLLGQMTEQFYVEPMGHVSTFAVRFYPVGFAHLVHLPLNELANKETPLRLLFGNEVTQPLSHQIEEVKTPEKRIEVIEEFLLERLKNKVTIDSIVKSTVDLILLSKGRESLNGILKEDLSKRRQLERKFLKHIGMSPKQLGKVIRLQATLQMLLNHTRESLTNIAYESEYFDQAHFIKDFKKFTGITPKEFLTDEKMILSSILYKKN